MPSSRSLVAKGGGCLFRPLARLRGVYVCVRINPQHPDIRPGLQYASESPHANAVITPKRQDKTALRRFRCNRRRQQLVARTDMVGIVCQPFQIGGRSGMVAPVVRRIKHEIAEIIVPVLYIAQPFCK